MIPSSVRRCSILSDTPRPLPPTFIDSIHAIRAAMLFDGEVVGFGGRMGSAFNRFSAGRLAQVGRNDDIGVRSPANSPIFVCTGVDAIEDVIRRTSQERVEDLVIMQVNFVEDRRLPRASRSPSCVHFTPRDHKPDPNPSPLFQNGILRPVVASHMATLGHGGSSVTLAVLYFSVSNHNQTHTQNHSPILRIRSRTAIHSSRASVRRWMH